MPIFKASGGGPQIDDGVYKTTVLAVDDAVAADGKEYWRWLCVVSDGSRDGLEMSAQSSQNTGPKSKPRRWLEALLGRQISDIESLSFESILPRDCLASIKRNAKGYASIDELLPVPRQPFAAQEPAEPAPPPPGADEEDIPF
jgi:hypothetical protein